MVVFDVCGTLFRENTTFGFALHVLKSRNFVVYFVANILFGRFGSMLEKAGLFSKRIYAISCLKGKSREFLYDSAETYVVYLVNDKTISRVFEQFLLAETKFLASASLDPVIASLSSYFNVSGYASSVLEYDDQGICTGRLAYDLKGNKHKIVKGLNAESMYTDNIDDSLCIEFASKFHCVIHSDKQERRFLCALSRVGFSERVSILHV